MERLTFEGNFCDIAKCGYRVCPHDGNCSQKQAWERLKQFEDAFGTPEKAERVKLAFMGKAVYEIKEFDGVPIKRLIELAQADKDGRVLVLSCKPGDTVFRAWVTPGRKPEITAHYVTDWGMVVRWAHLFGKTVFLTREEAEKALQEMEGKV